MADGEHPELDFDPLDDTKRWPEDKFPLARPSAGWCSIRIRRTSSPKPSSPRSAPVCWSTASISRTTRCCRVVRLPIRTRTRYRVGPNYLQLPVNAPAKPAMTNQRDGQMAYTIDGGGENPHVNYEPSCRGRIKRGAPPRPGLSPVCPGPPRPLSDHPDRGRLQTSRRRAIARSRGSAMT